VSDQQGMGMPQGMPAPQAPMGGAPAPAGTPAAMPPINPNDITPEEMAMLQQAAGGGM